MNAHSSLDPSPLPLVETVPPLTSPATAARAWPLTMLAASLGRRRGLLLGAALLIATAIRLVGLDASGFSDDEMNKVQAVQAYREGRFDANAEHPMLMKLLMLSSTMAADGWNRAVDGTPLPRVAPEAALRLPNALAGAATLVVLFLLVELLFDTPVAFAAALFWALDVNATGINRIGKEDSLLLFFLLLGAWLYERGKQVGRWDPARAQRWYAPSGAAFGLMLASKYMPHYFGLYALFNRVADPDPGANKPLKRWFYLALGAAFLAGNAALLLPEVWTYLRHYVAGTTLEHHGYLYAHRLYTNEVSHSPWGLPVTFYAVFLLTKVPLTTLTAIALGLGELWRRSRERGIIFVRIFLVLVLLPYSLIASKFLRYMLPLLAILDIVAALGLIWLVRRIATSTRLSVPLRTAAAALAGLALFAGPLLAQRAAAPYPSTYQNAIGRALSAGLLFPDDELYDFGVREAIAQVAQQAAPGAVVASEVPTVARWYLDAAGRADVATTRLSEQGVPAGVREGWVIAQDAHTYFENARMVGLLRRSLTPAARITLREHTAVELFRIPGQALPASSQTQVETAAGSPAAMSAGAAAATPIAGTIAAARSARVTAARPGR